MISNYTHLFFILALGAIGFFISRAVLIYRKKAALEHKVAYYEKFLQQAAQIRFAYLEALKNADESRIEIEALKNELSGDKRKLQIVRADLKKQVKEIRKLLSASDCPDKIESRAVAQKKAIFKALWRSLSSMKASFNTKRSILAPLHEKYLSMVSEEKQRATKWQQSKSLISTLYNELNSQIEITNPRDVLGYSSKEN
jgi:hypothetical protein